MAHSSTKVPPLCEPAKAASSQTKLPHLVYISVVGAYRIHVVSSIDRAMIGYFASKWAAERVVADSGLP
jgi:uncharacterized protein YbjT (DUF2867 family)